MITGGVNASKPGKLPPVPEYPATITNRASDPMLRLRLKLTRTTDIEKINALPGVNLLIEIEERDLLEIVSAEIYAVHPGGLIDCRVRGELISQSSNVILRRTSSGRTP